jgi:hypothetical protein
MGIPIGRAEGKTPATPFRSAAWNVCKKQLTMVGHVMAEVEIRGNLPRRYLSGAGIIVSKA